MRGARAQRRHFRAHRWLGLARLVCVLAFCLPQIMRLAAERHSDGISEYGDAMYHWLPWVRLVNLQEELADAIVYGSSGPVSGPSVKA